MMGFTNEGGAMDIQGAIFDCDGTLVDSMGMWRSASSWICEHHGVEPLPFEQIESLALRETCDMYHDEKGIGDSGEGLYEELCAHVRDAYEHEVPLMPGAREFLDELAACPW